MHSRAYGTRARVTLAAAAVAAVTATAHPPAEDRAVARVAATSATDIAGAAGVLDAELDENRAEHGLPGMIGLVRDGDSVHFASSGLGNRIGSVAADPRAKYRIGSVTKAFTATVVLQLAAEGKLSLDDTVERWLPGLITGQPTDSTITIRQLLNHTSGLTDFMGQPALMRQYQANLNPYQQWDERRLVELAVGTHRFAEPGVKHVYSNTGYVVADLIVQEVTGRSVAAEVTERIITPLGLSDTTFPESDPTIRGNHLHGYDDVRDVTVSDVGTFGAAADIVSTLEDVADFTRALVSGELLPPAQMEDLRTTVPAGASGEYGLGISRLTPCGEAWFHNGAVLGYAGFFFSSPDGAQQVVVATNNHLPGAADSPSVQATMQAARHTYCALRGSARAH